ncbi:CFC_HP_G0068320.mRNA.1.CDS.1 [Saccharomyces cerevisiae]|nr:CFC_HP_G0068320.mRNA.1.CDS.1 [Saccharomyces cerevisiae]CAI6648544.1 CFC_HP_G0068320.mRNA.1.CDS.1 [Saccharomyces cerevisiae]
MKKFWMLVIPWLHIKVIKETKSFKMGSLIRKIHIDAPGVIHQEKRQGFHVSSGDRVQTTQIIRAEKRSEIRHSDVLIKDIEGALILQKV